MDAMPKLAPAPKDAMTAGQYRRALKALDLSIVGAGAVLGIRRRQSQRYAHGDAEVPQPLAKLLRLALREGFSADELRAL